MGTLPDLLFQNVDIEMIVGHLDVMTGESVPQIFIDGKIDRPVVFGGAPAENGVLNGAGAVIGHLHGGGGICKHVGNGVLTASHAGGLDGLCRGVVGSGDGADHPGGGPKPYS